MASCTHPPNLTPFIVQVDTDELERIAVSIAQNAVVQTENSEAVTRLHIAASAIESDNMDPLGFGRIDTRVLSLVRNPLDMQQSGSMAWACRFGARSAVQALQAGFDAALPPAAAPKTSLEAASGPKTAVVWCRHGMTHL